MLSRQAWYIKQDISNRLAERKHETKKTPQSCCSPQEQLVPHYAF